MGSLHFAPASVRKHGFLHTSQQERETTDLHREQQTSWFPEPGGGGGGGGGRGGEGGAGGGVCLGTELAARAILGGK